MSLSACLSVWLSVLGCSEIVLNQEYSCLSVSLSHCLHLSLFLSPSHFIFFSSVALSLSPCLSLSFSLSLIVSSSFPHPLFFSLHVSSTLSLISLLRSLPLSLQLSLSPPLSLSTSPSTPLCPPLFIFLSLRYHYHYHYHCLSRSFNPITRSPGVLVIVMRFCCVDHCFQSPVFIIISVPWLCPLCGPFLLFLQSLQSSATSQVPLPARFVFIS